MPVILSDEIYKMEIFCRSSGQNSVNVKFVKVGFIATPPVELQDFVNSLSTRWAALMKAAINENAVYYGLRLTQAVMPPANPKMAQFAAADGAGTTTGDMLPPQVAGLIKVTTGVAGRRFRGRMYIPFPSESDSVVEGAPNAGYLAKVQPIITELATSPIITVGGSTVTYDYGLYPRPYTAFQWKEITGGLFRTRWATQRRRSFINRGDVVPF